MSMWGLTGTVALGVRGGEVGERGIGGGEGGRGGKRGRERGERRGGGEKRRIKEVGKSENKSE